MYYISNEWESFHRRIYFELDVIVSSEQGNTGIFESVNFIFTLGDKHETDSDWHIIDIERFSQS